MSALARRNTLRIAAVVGLILMLHCCGIASHAMASTIQYDDGDWEYQNPPLGGQATRFTVSGQFGPSWKVETLRIHTIAGSSPRPLTLKLWEDDNGAMGDTVFQTDAIITGNSWHWYDFDVSPADLVLMPGDSFFAGFDQATDAHGCWDSDPPHYGRGYRRWSWSSTWEAEEDNALIRVSGTSVPVPEPISMIFSATGVGVFGFVARRKMRKVS